MGKKKTKVLTYCCEKCKKFWYCVTKWVRGEKGEPQICCSKSNRYAICNK